jgi:hypothetical protein
MFVFFGTETRNCTCKCHVHTTLTWLDEVVSGTLLGDVHINAFSHTFDVTVIKFHVKHIYMHQNWFSMKWVTSEIWCFIRLKRHVCYKLCYSYKFDTLVSCYKFCFIKECIYWFLFSLSMITHNLLQKDCIYF